MKSENILYLFLNAWLFYYTDYNIMYVFCKNNYLKHLLLLHLDETMIIMFVAIPFTSIYIL